MLILGIDDHGLWFNWKNLEISICPLNLSQFSFIPLKYENQIFFEDFAKECAEHWNNLKIQSTKVETTKLFEQMTHWLWQFGTPIAAEGPHHLVQKINALTNKPCPRFGNMYLVSNRQQGRERGGGVLRTILFWEKGGFVWRDLVVVGTKFMPFLCLNSYLS